MGVKQAESPQRFDLLGSSGPLHDVLTNSYVQPMEEESKNVFSN